MWFFYIELPTCKLCHALKVNIIDNDGLWATFHIDSEDDHAVRGSLIQIFNHKINWNMLIKEISSD